MTNYELRIQRHIDLPLPSVILNSSFVIGFGGGISGCIKAAHAAAVLTFPAAVGVAGSTHFPLL